MFCQVSHGLLSCSELLSQGKQSTARINAKSNPGTPVYGTVTLIAQFTLCLLSQKKVLQQQRFGRVLG